MQVCTAIATVSEQNLCNTTKDMLPASCCQDGNFHRIPGSNAMPYHDDLCILAWSIKFFAFLAGFNSIRTMTLMQRMECSQQPDSLLHPWDQHVCIYVLRTIAALKQSCSLLSLASAISQTASAIAVTLHVLTETVNKHRQCVQALCKVWWLASLCSQHCCHSMHVNHFPASVHYLP